MTRTITVKGIGNVSARPDYITISLTLESLHKDYDEAMEHAAQRIRKLQDAAVRTGYAREALKTTKFNVETRYESVPDSHGNYKREFAGYACIYHLKLAFDFDSEQLARVISAIANSEANPELRIAFTVKDPAKVQESILTHAAENAKAKAGILCTASGHKLGKLLTIDYNWGECNLISRTSYEMEDAIQPLMARGRCAAPEIEPDDIEVSDSVTFTWEIE